MAIKCGKCKQYHEDVSEVRTCCGAAVPESERCTKKQALYLNQLRVERGLPTLDSFIAMTKREASAGIDRLLALPRAAELFPDAAGNVRPFPVRSGAWPDVPAGYYATPSRTGRNDLDFWRVVRPVDGQWYGSTFVHRVIGGRPAVRVRGAEARAALEAVVAAGVEAARLAYGREIGRCWRCNRHLTDETSRALGIGPDCRAAV